MTDMGLLNCPHRSLSLSWSLAAHCCPDCPLWGGGGRGMPGQSHEEGRDNGLGEFGLVRRGSIYWCDLWWSGGGGRGHRNIVGRMAG